MTANIPQFTNIPSKLKQYPNFVLWKKEEIPGRDKPAKIPYHVSGNRAKANDPQTWSDYIPVVSAFNPAKFTGVGFAMHDNTPFSGIDLDGCYCSAFNLTAPWAQEIVDAMKSYTEITPGGRGLRLFVQGKLPGIDGFNTRLTDGGGVEVYSKGHYLTITGYHLEGTPKTINKRQDALNALCTKYSKQSAKQATIELQPQEQRKNTMALGDRELLDKAFSAKNGAQFQALYNGDQSAYASQSEADAALCQHLAFWTGCDPATMERLFRDSRLFRHKWDERHYSNGETYGQVTIKNAIANTKNTYDPDFHSEELGKGKEAATAVPEKNQFSKLMITGGEAIRAKALLLEKQSYTIEKILPETAIIIMIYGAPGTCKTFIALDIGLSISREKTFHGLKTKKKSVLYIAAEGQAGALIRTEAWCKYYGIELDDHFTILPRPALIDNPSELESLLLAIKALPIIPQVVVLDTVARSMTGDENSTADMSKIVRAADRISEETGAQVIPIHHTGKDETRGARGALALTGATDIIFRVAQVKQDGEEYIALINERMKDGERLDTMLFKKEVVDSGIKDSEGAERTSLVLSYTGVLGKGEGKGKGKDGKTADGGVKGQAKIALDILKDILSSKGESPSEKVALQIGKDGIVTPETRVIHEDFWRAAAYSGGISESDAEEGSKRKAFWDARKKLLAAKVIGCCENYYWIK